MNLRFGIETAPPHVDNDEIVRAQREVDVPPALGDARLHGHRLPLVVAETRDWSAGVALRTTLTNPHERLRIGFLMTGNEVRGQTTLDPAALPVDVIANRLARGHQPDRIERSTHLPWTSRTGRPTRPSAPREMIKHE